MAIDKLIGLGKSDFKSLIENNCYFIDKSLFIKDIIDNGSDVLLITRPRRFGKTLNMSMLRYYFDQSIEGAEELFKGLKIMEQGEKYTSKLGYYPVIYMTLKGVKGDSYENMMEAMKETINTVYLDFAYLLDDEKVYPFEKEEINNIFYKRIDRTGLINSISRLSRCLNRIYNKPAILILDEYDVPIQTAYINGFYEEAIKFFQEFYVTTFKDNSYLQKTIITGVTRVSKESIFTGANNFTVCTVLDDEFSDDFGITKEEVNKALEDYDIEENIDKIKEWYDGYTIGKKSEIYNPWSILNYLRKKELMPYWVNTSGNDLVKKIVTNSSNIKEKMEKLLNGEEIIAQVSQETVMKDIEDNEENVWGLMLGTGYLKVTGVVDITESIYKVKLPNKEIRFLFQSIVKDWFKEKKTGTDLNRLLNNLTKLNFEEFNEQFELWVLQMFSYLDVGEDEAESFYHSFVLGMLVTLKDTYYVNSNRESGLGRYDIMLEPKDKNGNAFIMEFKVYRKNKEETIEDTIESAKKQIEEKKYEANLRERGFTNITKIVFAFKGCDRG